MSQHRPFDIAEPQLTTETPFPAVTAIPDMGDPAHSTRRHTPASNQPALADRSVGLTDAQIAEYRHRLARGFYASPAVVREVARRMIESGDL